MYSVGQTELLDVVICVKGNFADAGGTLSVAKVLVACQVMITLPRVITDASSRAGMTLVEGFVPLFWCWSTCH